MLDSLHSLTLTRDTGVDSNQIIKLMQKYPFTLQVEDPAEFWGELPDRYARFVKTYCERISDRKRLIFDLNIIPSRSIAQSRLPTQTQTGQEFAQMLHHASGASGRVAVYAESTLLPQDFEVMAMTLASMARVTPKEKGIVVETPHTVLVQIESGKEYRLDDRPWPFRQAGQLIIPPGKHEITEDQSTRSWIDWSQLALRLKSIHGELLNGNKTTRGLQFSYDAPSRTVVLLSKQPYEVWLDGRVTSNKPGFYQGDWSLNLPPGVHDVEIRANSPAYFLLDVASLLSSSLIVLAGFGTGGILALLYLVVLVRRRLRGRWVPASHG